MKKIILLFMLSVGLVFASIGKISAKKGSLIVKRTGQSFYNVNVGFRLEKQDILMTGPTSTVQIVFKDSTVITLGKNAKFAIEEYIYDKTAPKLRFNVARGAFKFISGRIGKIARNNFKIKTSNATIGIRGTVGGTDDAQRNYYTLHGEIYVIPKRAKVAYSIPAGLYRTLNKTSMTKIKKVTKRKAKELKIDKVINFATEKLKKVKLTMPIQETTIQENVTENSIFKNQDEQNVANISNDEEIVNDDKISKNNNETQKQQSIYISNNNTNNQEEEQSTSTSSNNTDNQEEQQKVASSSALLLANNNINNSQNNQDTSSDSPESSWQDNSSNVSNENSNGVQEQQSVSSSNDNQQENQNTLTNKNNTNLQKQQYVSLNNNQEKKQNNNTDNNLKSFSQNNKNSFDDISINTDKLIGNEEKLKTDLSFLQPNKEKSKDLTPKKEEIKTSLNDKMIFKTDDKKQRKEDTTQTKKKENMFDLSFLQPNKEKSKDLTPKKEEIKTSLNDKMIFKTDDKKQRKEDTTQTKKENISIMPNNKKQTNTGSKHNNIEITEPGIEKITDTPLSIVTKINNKPNNSNITNKTKTKDISKNDNISIVLKENNKNNENRTFENNKIEITKPGLPSISDTPLSIVVNIDNDNTNKKNKKNNDKIENNTANKQTKTSKETSNTKINNNNKTTYHNEDPKKNNIDKNTDKKIFVVKEKVDNYTQLGYWSDQNNKLISTDVRNKRKLTTYKQMKNLRSVNSAKYKGDTISIITRNGENILAKGSMDMKADFKRGKISGNMNFKEDSKDAYNWKSTFNNGTIKDGKIKADINTKIYKAGTFFDKKIDTGKGSLKGAFYGNEAQSATGSFYTKSKKYGTANGNFATTKQKRIMGF